MKSRYRYNEERDRYEVNLSETGREDWVQIESVEAELQHLEKCAELALVASRGAMVKVRDEFFKNRPGMDALTALHWHQIPGRPDEVNVLFSLVESTEEGIRIHAQVMMDFDKVPSPQVLASRLIANMEKRARAS